MGKLLVNVFLVTFLVFLGHNVEGLGVNWGDISSHKLPPKDVVKMLQENGIKKVKLFNNDETILNALAGTGIEVMIGISNQLLKDLVNPDVAKKWVKENVTRYEPKSPKGVNITLVGVGNEPFLRDYKDTLTNVTGPALENIQNALNDAGLGDTTKATVPLNADVYLSPSWNPVPSGGFFRADIIDPLNYILKVLNKNKAPFMVNIYPFLSLFYGNGAFPFDYAFFDGVSNPLKDKDGVEYTNCFDANLDTCAAALAGAGYGNMTIMVGEMGWPTDGNNYGNVTLAEKFYKGFVSYLAKGKGSPRRPGNVEAYLFALFDEDRKSTLPGNFETHWGLYYDDGTPKFPLDLHGNKKTLVSVPNVEKLSKKWCVIKPDVKNFTDLMTYACDRADCTPLTNGSSCQNLNDAAKASYAVNAYFQNNQQKDDSCNFEGKATVTTKDPSQGTCNFTIGFKSLTSLSPSPSPLPSSDHSDAKAPSSSSSSTSPSTPKFLAFASMGISFLVSLFFM
ncbi:glucan endo-1,3-beta-glucosidase 8-like [Solanum stenotomum]|uniref:glucan endo-1,3-beta-glucosidase 8-like n=1 Tax=Solanum stenotomum TaxID=172797 RepID=UPI0020D02B21|nr:glucan endo-1,3-beta-glucosidase 8-like [Solanum stenotomum]